MKLKHMSALAAATVATGVAAQGWPAATEARLTPEYSACMDADDAASGVHPAMMACSTEETARQDDRLNRTYRATMARLPKARRAALRSSERAWIARRDTRCRAAFERAGGGQGSQLEQSSCYLRETIERRMWLERYR